MTQTQNYAGQIVGATINGSTKLVDQAIEVAKGSFERSNAFLRSLQDVKRPDECFQISDKAVKQEVAAAGDYMRTASQVTAETANEIVELAEAGYAVADQEFVSKAKDAADAIPNGKDNPLGSLFQDAWLSQLEAYQAVSGAYAEAVRASRKNFAASVNGAATASQAQPVRKTRRSK